MTNKKTIEKFSKSPAIIRYQRIAWISLLVICTISISLSMYFENWEHFSRSGSLIVLVGAYIAYKDLSGDIYKLTGDNYVTFTELLHIGNIESLDYETQGELLETSEKTDKNVKNNKQFARYASGKLRKLEASFIVFGTIIWGYADLVLNFLWKFKA